MPIQQRVTENHWIVCEVPTPNLFQSRNQLLQLSYCHQGSDSISDPLDHWLLQAKQVLLQVILVLAKTLCFEMVLCQGELLRWYTIQIQVSHLFTYSTTMLCTCSMFHLHQYPIRIWQELYWCSVYLLQALQWHSCPVLTMLAWRETTTMILTHVSFDAIKKTDTW